MTGRLRSPHHRSRHSVAFVATLALCSFAWLGLACRSLIPTTIKPCFSRLPLHTEYIMAANNRGHHQIAPSHQTHHPNMDILVCHSIDSIPYFEADWDLSALLQKPNVGNYSICSRQSYFFGENLDVTSMQIPDPPCPSEIYTLARGLNMANFALYKTPRKGHNGSRTPVALPLVLHSHARITSKNASCRTWQLFPMSHFVSTIIPV